MRIQAVFFDFGDTLVHASLNFDTEMCITSLHQSLIKNRLPISYEDCRKAYIEAAEKFFSKDYIKEITFDTVLSETLNQLGYSLEPTDKIIGEAAEAYMEPWIQGRTIDRCLPSILRGLRKEHKLGIVSNITYSPAIRKTLEKFKLVNLFDAVITSVDIGWRKPSPKIFKKALKALDVSASESVFVGDELDHDVEGAQKVGMQTILLKLQPAKERPHRIQPDETIYGLHELLRALNRLETKKPNNPRSNEVE